MIDVCCISEENGEAETGDYLEGLAFSTQTLEFGEVGDVTNGPESLHNLCHVRGIPALLLQCLEWTSERRAPWLMAKCTSCQSSPKSSSGAALGVAGGH